jgi:hypothetical protein
MQKIEWTNKETGQTLSLFVVGKYVNHNGQDCLEVCRVYRPGAKHQISFGVRAAEARAI